MLYNILFSYTTVVVRVGMMGLRRGKSYKSYKSYKFYKEGDSFLAVWSAIGDAGITRRLSETFPCRFRPAPGRARGFLTI